MNENSAIKILEKQFSTWGNELVDILPYLLVALLVQFLFIIIAKLSRKVIIKVLDKFSHSKAVNQLTANIISFNIIIGGLVVALGVLNLDKTVTTLLAGAGIIGLALGFAFQDLVANIIAGILIAIRKPFNIGDLIETNDIFGDVLDIRLRTIEIHNRNGQIIFIPSKEVLQKPVYNYSKMRIRRIVIEGGIAFNEDLEFVKGIVLNAISNLSVTLHDQPIEFFYKEFSESSIKFMARYWIKFNKQRDYRQAVSDGIISIKAELDKHNIKIPYPMKTLDVNLKDDSNNIINRETVK